MRPTSTIVLQIVLSIAVPLSATAARADAASGKALFDRLCARCHQASTSLDTPPDAVADVLGSGRVRAHRFRLTDDQFRDLIGYLSEVGPNRGPAS